jgi:ring-1,2-phenylacetyl-CoA epoxidase subunit PaaE
MQFYPLKVTQITAETPDAKTFTLEVPAELREIFAYQQGQYITLKMELDGHELRRSYSMSSSPLDAQLAVTVKKVQGGRMSGYLHDQLQTGDVLPVAPPDGRFFVPLNPEKRRTYYLFGSGSGITPLMSILRTVLEGEPISSVFLLYGSRSEDNIIFRDELDRLTERYAGQLHVEHILSKPKTETQSGGLFGLLKKHSVNWQGKIGRIDGRRVPAFLDDNPPHTAADDCVYFVCGPDNMPDVVKVSLLGRGIAAGQIYTEHFANALQAPGENISDADSGEGARLVVTLKGRRIETRVPDGATILDVLVKEKYDPPYSCTAGACSTCMAKVLHGTVHMEVCFALDPEEVKAGYCLTCQAKPTSGLVEVTFDE